MTGKQKFILFLIGNKIAINQYSLIKYLDRIDFPCELTLNINLLKEKGFLFVSGYLDNKTEFSYSLTDKGNGVMKSIKKDEILDYLNDKKNNEMLLQIVDIVYERKI